ncbi:MAG: polymer-forming cytoskeletal protein [Acidobacteriota bacterium]
MAVKKRAPAPIEMNGFIGPGMEVHGTVRFKDLLRVDGYLEGRVESYEHLVVGETGRVEAEVIVGSLEVHGKVSGKISVDHRVEILPGARVEGELYASAPAVQISKGGVFDGELFMIPAPGDDDGPATRADGDPSGRAPGLETGRQDP